MAATFPAELTDCIIDFLHSDKHTLSECSLVCKSWVPASRYHLFRELPVTRAKAQSLVRRFRSATTKDDTGASGKPSPLISDKTRQLPRGLEFFSYVQSVSWSWITYKWDTREATLAVSVMQIVASFPQLSEFSITDSGIDNLPLRYLRNIKKFSNYLCHPSTGTAIVIANNPGLEHLEISHPYRDFGVPVDVFANIPPNSLPLKLRHLRVAGFLFHPSLMPHLRSLTYLEWVEQPWNPNDLSAELWQTLKSEKIRLSRLNTSLVHDSLLDFLSSFQGMRDLRLERLRVEGDSNHLARRLFQVALAKHADTLETLHIHARCRIDWSFVHHDITPILNCTNLRELGLSVHWLHDFKPPGFTPVFRLLNLTCELPRLRLLEITSANNSVASSNMIHDAISRFDPYVDGGAIRTPVSKVHAVHYWFEWRGILGYGQVK